MVFKDFGTAAQIITNVLGIPEEEERKREERMKEGVREEGRKKKVDLLPLACLPISVPL